MDCSEIAEDFLAMEPRGRLVTFRPGAGEKLRVLEFGRLEEYDYHTVYVLDGRVYDPRHAGEPIPWEEYVRRLEAANGGRPVRTEER